MTPQDAVDRIVRTGVTRNDRIMLRYLFESVATMAKEHETRRCAALVGGGYLGNEILRTGGLETEV